MARSLLLDFLASLRASSSSWDGLYWFRSETVSTQTLLVAPLLLVTTEVQTLATVQTFRKKIKLYLFIHQQSAFCESLPRPFFFLLEEAIGFFRDLSGVLLVNVRVGLPPLDIWKIFTIIYWKIEKYKS